MSGRGNVQGNVQHSTSTLVINVIVLRVFVFSTCANVHRLLWGRPEKWDKLG